MNDALFRNALAARNIIPSETLIANGEIQRCDVEGKNGKKDGAYLLRPDGSGGLENHCDGQGWENFFPKIEPALSNKEVNEFQKQIETVSRQHESQREREYARVAKISKETYWHLESASIEHPYLVRKGIQNHRIKECNGNLIIPLCIGEDIHSLQTIYPNGSKRFSQGGRITGCYYSIGIFENAHVLCISEGFATGASLHESTGYPVAVAFTAGNLLAVSKAMRERFPEKKLVICSDDDYRTKGNPGITKAREAAKAVNGIFAVPEFGETRPDSATDFNDLYQLQGLAAVRAVVQKAIEPDNSVLENLTKLDIDSEIARLSALSAIAYDRVRKTEAQRMGIRQSTLDNQVKEKRTQSDQTYNSPFREIEVWNEPVAPDVLLSEIASTIRRFIVCNPETIHAATLWIAMTWFMDIVQIAPIAIITAPEKRCGKSQLLFLMARMTCKPLSASNITPAALFRSIDQWHPTLLIDEADAFLKENEELRGLLNCGHTRESAYSIRTVGENHTPTRFNLWGAKALAGIGHLADTLMDRAIVLELRRRLSCEHVEKLRHADKDIFDAIQRKLARFAEDYKALILNARPALPEELHDRAQDNWEPLLAIADVSGGEWPVLARKAALKLSGENESTQSQGIELLADIQEVFETKHINKIFTANLVEELCKDSEKIWSTYNRGKPITPSQLSRRLSEYGINSKSIRIDYHNKKGFDKSQFDDAFTRYLSISSETPKIPDTPSQNRIHEGFHVTDGNDTAMPFIQSVTAKTSTGACCDGVSLINSVLKVSGDNIVEKEL